MHIIIIILLIIYIFFTNVNQNIYQSLTISSLTVELLVLI